jgi:hypothetical protein
MEPNGSVVCLQKPNTGDLTDRTGLNPLGEEGMNFNLSVLIYPSKWFRISSSCWYCFKL